jgi:hypothetical protein
MYKGWFPENLPTVMWLLLAGSNVCPKRRYKRLLLQDIHALCKSSRGLTARRDARLGGRYCSSEGLTSMRWFFAGSEAKCFPYNRKHKACRRRALSASFMTHVSCKFWGFFLYRIDKRNSGGHSLTASQLCFNASKHKIRLKVFKNSVPTPQNTDRVSL